MFYLLINTLLSLITTDYTVTCSGEFFDECELYHTLVELETDIFCQLCYLEEEGFISMSEFRFYERIYSELIKECDVDELRALLSSIGGKIPFIEEKDDYCKHCGAIGYVDADGNEIDYVLTRINDKMVCPECLDELHFLK